MPVNEHLHPVGAGRVRVRGEESGVAGLHRVERQVAYSHSISVVCRFNIDKEGQ